MATDPKRYLGDEFPAAVTINGVRLSLASEDRWNRSYWSEDRTMCYSMSRFMDGSAAITLAQLMEEWSTWSAADRLDFCSACSWLGEQKDFPDMLRFIMEHGGPDEWTAIANSVATRLPQDEAFDLLVRALRSVRLDQSANLSQGISITKHPGAEAVLREHLAALCSDSTLWEDADFTNWIAFGATCCIAHLIAVGASPGDFEKDVRKLAEHVCAGNRDSCARYLAKYYAWLEEPPPPSWALSK